MLGVLTRFAGELRAAGLPVSLTETIDAASAVRQLPLDDRGVLRSALAATLVKREDHRATFDLLFDVFFAGGELPVPTGEGSPEGLPAGFGLLGEDDDGSDEVEAVLLAGDVPRLAAFARRAVARHAGIEPGRPGAAAYHRFRTLRAIDLDGAFERVVARAGASVSGLQARLLADEYGVRAERVRREVDAEIRRRLAALRGAEEVAGAIRRPLPEDLDVMHAGGEELARLQGAVRPLARKLAAHLARKRRHRRGGLDFRSTVRHSLSYGGVPAEPRFRHPRPSRPEILVLADVSGSVAAFARFTLQFVHAVSSQFSRVRSFAFVDDVDEVTRFFEGSDDPAEAARRVGVEASVAGPDGHSDYGRALEAFWRRWGDEVTPRTSVIVLGDARNNYHRPGSEVLAELGRQARHLWWLNPEPRSYWDTGDSVMSQYAVHCDGVFECRSLRQLERFVEAIAG